MLFCLNPSSLKFCTSDLVAALTLTLTLDLQDPISLWLKVHQEPKFGEIPSVVFGHPLYYHIYFTIVYLTMM